MRSLLLLIIAVLYLILTLPVLLVLWLIGLKRPDLRGRASRAMVRFIFRVLLWGTGTKPVVLGAERIPKDTAVLFVGNHRSIFDVIISYPYMHKDTGIVAKSSLNSVPLFNIWARFVGCLFFDRDDLKAGMKMIMDGISRMKNGTSIFIFPEGTRNRAAEDLPLLPFHEGSFRLAMRSGCPIVPIAFCNTIDIWEGHFPWIRKTKAVVEFGEPVYPDDIPKEMKKQVGARVSEIITEMVQKNQALL